MSRIEYQIDINAPVERVYEYYTNPDNIKYSYPRDIVKESENVSGQKSEEGSEMKVTGEYMGTKDEMILEVFQRSKTGDWSQGKQRVRYKNGNAYKSFKATGTVPQGSATP